MKSKPCVLVCSICSRTTVSKTGRARWCKCLPKSPTKMIDAIMAARVDGIVAGLVASFRSAP